MIILQKRVKRELDLILPQIKNGVNLNILLRAPSGYGKTVTGLMMLKYLDPNYENSTYSIPPDENTVFEILKDKRFHFIDEIHIIKNPEYLYEYMDSNNYTFLFATNESGSLKEPLRNRCFPIIFGRYIKKELMQIVDEFLKGYNLPDEFLKIIADRVKGNPRIAKILCMRLQFVFTRYGICKTEKELTLVLDTILYVKENGITELDEIYLNYLSTVKLSSLSNIVNSTKIDRYTITNEIEPNLLEKGIISITGRGRKYND